MLPLSNMPFKSKAQAKYLFAKKPELAKEFASKTKSIKALPEKVKQNKVNKKKTFSPGGYATAKKYHFGL